MWLSHIFSYIFGKPLGSTLSICKSQPTELRLQLRTFPWSYQVHCLKFEANWSEVPELLLDIQQTDKHGWNNRPTFCVRPQLTPKRVFWMIKISKINLTPTKFYFHKIFKTTIFFINPAKCFCYCFTMYIYKKKMFTIVLEDGREAP